LSLTEGERRAETNEEQANKKAKWAAKLKL
jgi:hypothetical protein